MRVVPMDIGEVVAPGGHRDHPGTVRLAQSGQQAGGELEGAQVVDRELLLVASRVTYEVAAHDPSVADQDMQRPFRGEVLVCERVHGGRVDQVERDHFDAPDTGERWRGP